MNTPKICCNHPKIWTRWLYHRVMHPKDAAGIANSVDPDQTRSSLIWVCTVCPDLSVQKLRIITVPFDFNVGVAIKQSCWCPPNWNLTSYVMSQWCQHPMLDGERGGSVVECRTPEREVRGSRPTAAVLCPWARHFTPRKYWLITQEAMAPSRHDWKIVDWDVKPQHNQPTNAWRQSYVTS